MFLIQKSQKHIVLLCSGRLMPQMQFVVGFGFCLFVFTSGPTLKLNEVGKKPTTTGYAPSKTHWLHLLCLGSVSGPVAQDLSYLVLSSAQLELCQELQCPIEQISGNAASVCLRCQHLPHQPGSPAEGSVSKRGVGKWGLPPHHPWGHCRGRRMSIWGRRSSCAISELNKREQSSACVQTYTC